ncbi:hypothetical protein RRG08_057975 [Elysia crispata]|uniref:Uncharacterized protein n=1 Tax=Elysia crispata TaxID=231223 RepID=A0AAE1AF71_9GAST|nr:hypothetical protein RRG08_057975 [Elysia crispata]
MTLFYPGCEKLETGFILPKKGCDMTWMHQSSPSGKTIPCTRTGPTRNPIIGLESHRAYDVCMLRCFLEAVGSSTILVGLPKIILPIILHTKATLLSTGWMLSWTQLTPSLISTLRAD